MKARETALETPRASTRRRSNSKRGRRDSKRRRRDYGGRVDK
jgi:hypothetical protein